MASWARLSASAGLVEKIAVALATGFRILWLHESHCTTKTLPGRTWLTRGLYTAQ